MPENKFTIRASKLDTSTILEPGGKPGDIATVTFTIGVAPRTWEIPIYVNRQMFDDQDIIPIARSFFATFVQTLARQTADWKMSDADVDVRKRPPEK